MNDQEPIRQVASSKEEILASLKEHGYRLTEQRKLIVDIIANEEYTCCKEVYFWRISETTASVLRPCTA